MKPSSSTARDLAKLLSRMEQRIAALERGARTSQLQSASITGTAITVYDEDGTTRRGSIGIQPDGTIGFVAEGGPAPAAPTAPIVTPSIAGLRVTWDGAFADGSVTPSDFDHVAVHVSTTSGFTPSAATFVGTITLAGDGGVLPVTPLTYEQHYVLLVGVNTSGVAGDPSTEASGTPLQVDGPDLTVGSVTAGAIEAGAVTADKLEAILSLVNRIVAGDPAGARVELNSGGLRVYDATGAETVRFDGADGSAVFTGEVTGSTVTGGTINGSTVTGGTLQTGASGPRVLISPTPPAPTAQYPSMVLYSDTAGEIGPAILSAKADLANSARPATNLTSPHAYIDPNNIAPEAILTLAGPKDGSFGGRFLLLAYNPGSGSTIGNAIVEGRTADTPSGTSFLKLTATNGGTTSPKTSNINITGTNATITTDGSAHVFQASGLTVDGVLATQLASTTDTAVSVFISGDTASRFVADANGKLSWGPGNAARDTTLYRAAANTLATDDNLTVGGVLNAKNIAYGKVTITPSAADTPTSVQVTGLNVAGSTFTAFATANTSVPGTTVKGVGINNVSSTGLTVWLTRGNTTATDVWWMVIGS